MKTFLSIRLQTFMPELLVPVLLISSLLPMPAAAESVGEAVRVREIKPDPVVVQTRPVTVEQSLVESADDRRSITYSTTQSNETCFYHEEHGHIHCEESVSEAPYEASYNAQYQPERIILVEERERYPGRYYTRYQTRYENRRYHDSGIGQGIGIGLAIGLPIILHHSFHDRHYSGHGRRFGHRGGHHGGHNKRNGHRKGHR